MKYLKRFLALQLLFLAIIPIAFGEIIVDISEKDIYNLGEKVIPTVSVKESQDYSGFFKLSIFCDNYELQYYTIPLSLETDFRTQLTVPELLLAESMASKCRLRADFELSDGAKIDSTWSEYFFVTDELNVTVDSSLEAKPGEDVVISGQVKKQSNEIMSKGESKISFRNKENKVDTISGKFEHIIHLDEDVKAGTLSFLVVATDKYGNYGDKILDFEVLPIPTRIENRFENNVLMPGDKLRVKAILYDHSNLAMDNSEINVKVLDSDEKLIVEKDVQSSNSLEFEMGENQKPGNYFLLSTFENIKQQSSFEMGIVREITMEQEGNFVHVENIGNVNYEDEVTIILESDDKNYPINEKINLEPGEKITIDLSKEVPQGTYDIILPEEIVDDTVQGEDTNGSSGQTEDSTDVAGPVNIIQDVQIDDNRNVIKKITGEVVGAAGYVASKPLLASTFLILIILGTVTRYSWGFIKNRIKGKKEDSTEDLFGDFKYEEDGDNKPGD